ncbi:MAG: hypothetical protein U0T80_00075 [Flavobacteriaceae bacterium]
MDNVSIFYPANAYLANAMSGWGGGFKVEGGEGHGWYFLGARLMGTMLIARSFDVLERLRGGAMMHKFFLIIYILIITFIYFGIKIYTELKRWSQVIKKQTNNILKEKPYSNQVKASPLVLPKRIRQMSNQATT